MRIYSFNDFKYISYVEGKNSSVEMIFSDIFQTKKLKAFQKRIKKNEMDLKSIYNEYLQHQSIVNN
ncbi:TPA: hypothetical protein ACGTPT_001708 [Listeria innocua]